MGFQWKKVITSGITGDKKKDMNHNLRCPYATCPSNQPFVSSRPPKMRFIERVQPYVHKYECRYCGFTVLVGVEGEGIPDLEHAHMINPNLLHARK